MNTFWIIAPLAAASVLAIGVTAVHRRLPPKRAAQTLAVTLVVVLGAAVPTVLILSLGYLTHIPLLGTGFEWCARVFGVHENVPAGVGIPASIAAVAGTWGAIKVLRSQRRLSHHHVGPVEVVTHDQPFAFTLPGRAGHIVISSGLVEFLDEDELSVVLNHERAHGRHRHDRYLVFAKLGVAVAPILRPLSSRLEFSLERWADESAALACDNRAFVARTLGKVALGTPSPAMDLSFARLGVAARMTALLEPMATPTTARRMAPLYAGIAVTGLLAIYQLHHLAKLIVTLCPG
jgi:Zn-dependent protease with chaperone function